MSTAFGYKKDEFDLFVSENEEENRDPKISEACSVEVSIAGLLKPV